MRFAKSLLIVALLVPASRAVAQDANYDESKIPAFTLPDPLVDNAGKTVSSPDAWPGRRAEILELFEKQVYGVQPSEPVGLEVESVHTSGQGDVRRKMITLRCSRNGRHVDLHMLMYLPKSTPGPHRVFVGLNFNGNHTISAERDIPVTRNWVRNNEKLGYSDHRATDASRGSSASRWPIETIVGRGYGVATIYYGDIDPDFDDGFVNGVHALYADQSRTDSSWGSISTWAWGLSRAMDYFQRDADVDATRVIVMGHSRLGKTALWAGASDPRFAMVVSNNSGCGGAALSRRRFGESVQRINTSFPHWFCDNFTKYNGKEDDCPVDQHMLVALIAPRPVLICSAEEDRWADPKGEFESGRGAHDVYRLLGTDGMAADSWPGVNHPILSRIGYHMRPGKHDVKLQDWNIYMDFADKHLD